jgi:hypothetical protein
MGPKCQYHWFLDILHYVFQVDLSRFDFENLHIGGQSDNIPTVGLELLEQGECSS